MPNLRQSRQVSTRNYKPVDPVKPQTATVGTPVPTEDPQQASPSMLSSMPAFVSGSDALQRQFYGIGNVPQYRILPTIPKGART